MNNILTTKLSNTTKIIDTVIDVSNDIITVKLSNKTVPINKNKSYIHKSYNLYNNQEYLIGLI